MRKKDLNIFLLVISILIFIYILTRIRPRPFYNADDVLMIQLLESSDEQLLIEKKILLQTISFMLEETQELDQKLISFVSTLIHKPNLNRSQLSLIDKKKRDFSQIGQSKFIDKLLNFKRNGFFIEAGGFDGESHSVNTSA